MQLHVQWEGWDAESGIADYEVGLRSTKSATVSPDIHPYTSTKYHPNLAQGALFYIVVRATNRALLSTTKLTDTVQYRNSGISLATNHFWTAPDQDFTRSRDTLAAAWPSLRHGDYYWKVLSADSIECWSYHRHGNEINYHSFRCDEPETLRCGQTKEVEAVGKVEGRGLVDALAHH
ncbi:hypothetical protein Bbelb_111100 [Branchiostoma belcheri]|nr:hypothetical protein Bbelb_111100 [Branchiostoma belcheri]